MMHIIISATTAKAIRGDHGKYSAVEPLPLGDGKYLIPENVLSDDDLKEITRLVPISNPRKTIEEIKKLYPDFQKYEEPI